MFAKFLIAPLFIASSVVAAPAFVRRGDVSLSDWSNQNLESYWTFKMRYNSLDCASQNGTDFYNTCCSPLGANQTMSDLPAECTPTTCAAPSNSTVQSTPTYDAAPAPTESTSDDDDDDDGDCDDGDDSYDDSGDYSSSDDGSEGDSFTEYDSATDSPADYDYSTDSPTDSPTDYDPPTDSPTPTPTDNDDPDPSSSQDDPQPTTTQAQDNTDSNSGNANGGGYATYFYQGGNPGACGNYHSDHDMIAAIDVNRYGDTSQVSSLCGQKVHITNSNNGNSVDVIIADACPSCANSNSIDLSVGAFQMLAPLSDGMVPITWSFA